MIFLLDVNEQIERLIELGDKVSNATHCIYTSKSTKFDNDLYPLEIIITDNMPDGTACIITRKVDVK